MKLICVVSLLVTMAFNLLAAETVPRILMVVTSYDGAGTDHETGYWAHEYTIPYKQFLKAGFQVTTASPKGGKPPVDKLSLNEQFLAEKNELLHNSLKLSDVKPEDFDALFIVGGHGAIWDLVNNQELSNIIKVLNKSGKIISAVCHGPSALVFVKNDDGTLLLSNHTVTGFSIEEETKAKLLKYVLSSPLGEQLEERLISAVGKNGKYLKKAPRESHVIVSRNIITGQNPASSNEIALTVIRKMTKSK